MQLLLVTPAHNERDNLSALAQQLLDSSSWPGRWVIVDDGSDDGTGELARALRLPFPVTVVERANSGGLIGGSAFLAWQYGVDCIRDRGETFAAVMKLDADVELPPGYLEAAMAELQSDPRLGLVGGVLAGKADREQTLHVPGPVKLYSRAGYEALQAVPRRVGFDVVDELAIKQAGLGVRVRKDLPFAVRRAIGASQGLVHGRRRNGQVCRWTGYWFPYFLLHALRYALRKPYLVGTLAMLYGYARAGEGPYSAELRRAHAREQRGKLRAAVRNPRKWLTDAYGVTA